MTQDSEKNQRPLLITIVCIFGFIGGILVFLGLFIGAARDPVIQQYGPSVIPITIVSGLFGLGGLIGFWMMRKWGLYVYSANLVFGIISGMIVGMPFSIGYILPIFVAILGFIYFKQMS